MKDQFFFCVFDNLTCMTKYAQCICIYFKYEIAFVNLCAGIPGVDSICDI